MPQLLNKYEADVVPAMMEQFGYTNPRAVPRLEKIVISAGVGRGSEEKDRLNQALEDLTQITGQRAVATKARKSIAGFNIRRGMPVGVRVTLRGARMYEFLLRLIALAIPRIRDFRGLSRRAFDGSGNYTFGIDEQGVFPEIDPDSIQVTQGMNISLVTTAATDEEGRELLRQLGMPFAREE
ncbi:MAG: 50S ribosomal protein L5 [Planctomycetota bacterium]